MATPALAVRHQKRRHSTAVDAALVYVGLRLVSAAVILLAQRDQPPVTGLSRAPYLGMLTHWDGQWFQSVATSGYPHHLPHELTGAVAMNQWAFYPGFPFLARAVMQVTDTGFATAASLVDLVCGLVAAIAMARLLQTRIPRTATLAVVAVWAALPMAPSLQLAYSEALALALLSLTLLWLQGEHWARAGVTALLLGLTRPMLPPLAVVFAVAVWLRWRRRVHDPVEAGRTTPDGRRTPRHGRRSGRVALDRLVVHRRARRLHPHRSGLAPRRPGTLRRVRRPAPGGVARCSSSGCESPFSRRSASPRRSPSPPSARPASTRLLATWCVAYLVFDLAVGNMHADEFRLLLPLFPLVAVGVGVASTPLATRWRERAWIGVTLGLVGQYAWVMLCVRFLPGVPRAP